MELFNTDSRAILMNTTCVEQRLEILTPYVSGSLTYILDIHLSSFSFLSSAFSEVLALMISYLKPSTASRINHNHGELEVDASISTLLCRTS